jgi:hypothetical protein
VNNGEVTGENVTPGRPIQAPAGRRGIDMSIEYEGLVKVVEFKRSNWDAMEGDG